MRHASLVLAGLVAVLLPVRTAAAQPFHLDDSLRGATSGNPTGGTFDASGWTVTGPSDRIWYAVPRLVSGSVEFTLAHVTPASLPLPDHEIFAMYEDGYGIGEPIAYAPYFRGNAYKVLVRIYGMVEPSRVGAMKLMWGMCPSGAPGYDACGCTSFFDEPFASPGAWTGDPVRIRVEWGSGHSRLLRDGAEVVSVDYSASGLEFGPSELHVMLGSPRNDGGLAAMPIGATFSDLVIDGTEGPLAMCPGGSVDAGTTMDAGTCGASSAVQDGTAAIWEPGPFPDPTDLNVEGDASGPSAVAYLRFPAVSGTVTHATLTMHASSSPSAAGGSGVPCRVDGASWDESTLTWASRPTVSTACAGTARTIASGDVVSWDVTSLVSAGHPIDLAIVSSDPDGAHYLSREAGGCTLGPTLDVSVVPGSDAGALDASSPIDAAVDAASMDAAGDAGTRGGALSAGCGCTVAGARDRRLHSMVWLVLLGLFTVRRRGAARTHAACDDRRA